MNMVIRNISPFKRNAFRMFFWHDSVYNYALSFYYQLLEKYKHLDSHLLHHACGQIHRTL